MFKGDVFEMVNQAVEFVLNKLDYRIETRKEHVSIPGRYEIPKEIINEAIIFLNQNYFQPINERCFFR